MHGHHWQLVCRCPESPGAGKPPPAPKRSLASQGSRGRGVGRSNEGCLLAAADCTTRGRATGTTCNSGASVTKGVHVRRLSRPGPPEQPRVFWRCTLRGNVSSTRHRWDMKMPCPAIGRTFGCRCERPGGPAARLPIGGACEMSYRMGGQHEQTADRSNPRRRAAPRFRAGV
jgi:hypothetical protein